TNDAEPSADEALWLSEPDVQRALAIIRSSGKAQKPVQPSSNLELDLGFDSMERVELVVALEREFGVDVEDKVISQVYTVRELVDTILRGYSQTAAGAATANATGATGHGTGASSSARPRPSAAAGWDAVLAADPAGDTDAAAVNRTLHTSVVFTFCWFVLAKAALLLLRIFFGLSVSGRERLPRPHALAPVPAHVLRRHQRDLRQAHLLRPGPSDRAHAQACARGSRFQPGQRHARRSLRPPPGPN